MVKKCLIAVLLLGVMGCVPMVWVKPGGTEAGFASDKARCEYEINLAVRAPQTQGLATPFGAAYDMALQKNELMGYCLKAKGYALVKQSSKR